MQVKSIWLCLRFQSASLTLSKLPINSLNNDRVTYVIITILIIVIDIIIVGEPNFAEVSKERVVYAVFLSDHRAFVTPFPPFHVGFICCKQNLQNLFLSSAQTGS